VGAQADRLDRRACLQQHAVGRVADGDAVVGQPENARTVHRHRVEAGLHAVANPLINITLQGRHDSYPKRRGMTRVPELLAAGVNVGFGHDCVMDPWYPLGSADMLEVAQMGLHVAQMTSLDGMRACFEAVTVNNARVLGLDGYGIVPGHRADCVLLQARSPIEAIRLRAQRVWVMRHGKVIARSPVAAATLDLPGRPATLDWGATPCR
jgi:cytosine deaminase